MRDHLAGRPLVVDRHVVGRAAGDPLPQQHERAAGADRGEVLGVEGDRGEDHAVDPVAGVALRRLALPLRATARLVDQHGVAARRGGGDERVGQGAEVGLVDPRHGEGEDVAPPALQLAPDHRGPVVQLVDGLEHPPPGLGRDVRALVDHVRHGLQRDPRQGGDVLDPCGSDGVRDAHEITAPSACRRPAS